VRERGDALPLTRRLRSTMLPVVSRIDYSPNYTAVYVRPAFDDLPFDQKTGLC